MGFEKETDEKKANFILFNTCCIRENAENTLFGRLGSLKKQKQNNENTYIAVVGCMTQQKHIIDKIKESYKFVDIVLGTGAMSSFPIKVYNILKENKKEIEFVDVTNEVEEEVPIKFEDKYKASVSIIYGCNNFCSYCIVPYVRGRERSRNPEDIINEVKEVVKQGYKEIMLLGQNVNSYMRSENKKGECKSEINSFAKLLREINKIEGIERIRFISPHPKDFTDDVIDVIASEPVICRHIHLPVQNGSSAVLKAMNRRYTREQYLELVAKIKAKIPEVSLTTDIMMGFPGETEEDVEQTLDLMRTVKYESAMMYYYNPREGTPAAKMEQIPEEVRKERLQRVIDLQLEHTQERMKERVGGEALVLAEGISRDDTSELLGQTEQHEKVAFKADRKLIGSFVNVKITSLNGNTFKVEII